MTASLTKKRPRSDDCEECLPISKRINRLQIESGTQPVVNGENSRVESNSTDCNIHGDLSTQCRNLRINSDPTHQLNPHYNNPCSSSCLQCRRLSLDEYQREMQDVFNEAKEGYKPDLKEEENPHYFRVNKLLFDAHLQRAERTLVKFPD